jgi:hypothetical protein
MAAWRRCGPIEDRFFSTRRKGGQPAAFFVAAAQIQAIAGGTGAGRLYREFVSQVICAAIV